MAAITSLTVQNTKAWEAVHNTPSAGYENNWKCWQKNSEIGQWKVGMLAIGKRRGSGKNFWCAQVRSRGA